MTDERDSGGDGSQSGTVAHGARGGTAHGTAAHGAGGRVTWENTISGFFTQLDIGCMRGVKDFEPRLDLGSYESVVIYRMNIYYALKKGQMPPGGPRWSDEKLEIFHKWMSQDPPPRK